MKLDHYEYSQRAIMERVGNLSQIGGTRHYELSDGRARGVRAIDFETGGGLSFTILPDRCLDISRAQFKGMNLAYRSVVGEVHPSYYDARGIEWLRGFFAGLLTTCGLTYLGPAGSDGGQDLGLHGRISHTPAMQVCDLSGWRKGDEYELAIKGVMEEAWPFFEKLRMTRTITALMGSRSLRIEDEILNFGFASSPLTILYHINTGFPLLDEQSELMLSAATCTPKDEYCRQAMDQRFHFTVPQQGFAEQVFLHQAQADASGMASAVLINRHLSGGLGLYVRFPVAQLPYISEWKMMGAGDYVVGMEPSNVPCENRSALRQKEMLPMIEPGETQKFTLDIGILDGLQEIEQFQSSIQ